MQRNEDLMPAYLIKRNLQRGNLIIVVHLES